MSFDPKRPPGTKPPSIAPMSRPTPPPGTLPRTAVPGSMKPPSNVKDAMREALASSGGAALSRPSTAPGSIRPGKKTIMVVDDDAAMRGTLRRALEGDYDVIEAKDGMEAVEMLGTLAAPPSMVVCDIMMPRVDGFTFAKIMRANAVMKKVPIMFVSSRNSPQEVTQALVLGACQYVPKTTPVSQIVDKIKKIVV